MTFKRSTKLGLAVAAALGFASSANASLIQVGADTFQGVGLGSVNTILTMTSPGATSTETASVGLNASGVQVITGDAQTGASQTQVRSLSTLGVTSAANLRVVFNASEPGGDSINLNNLVLNIFSPTGTVLFTSGAFSPVAFPSSNPGVGNAGFVFALDGTQAAAAQTAAFGAGFGTNLVGLSASASNATGGLETFFVAQAPGQPPTAIPEPETYAMLLSGLGLLGFIATRRRRKL
jgi:hypothetical protein